MPTSRLHSFISKFVNVCCKAPNIPQYSIKNVSERDSESCPKSFPNDHISRNKTTLQVWQGWLTKGMYFSRLTNQIPWYRNTRLSNQQPQQGNTIISFKNTSSPVQMTKSASTRSVPLGIKPHQTTSGKNIKGTFRSFHKLEKQYSDVVLKKWNLETAIKIASTLKATGPDELYLSNKT